MMPVMTPPVRKLIRLGQRFEKSFEGETTFAAIFVERVAIQSETSANITRIGFSSSRVMRTTGSEISVPKIAAVEPLRAAARSRLVVSFLPKITLTNDEIFAIVDDPVLSKLQGTHFLALDNSGILSVLGLVSIPILGLTDDAIVEREAGMARERRMPGDAIAQERAAALEFFERLGHEGVDLGQGPARPEIAHQGLVRSNDANGGLGGALDVGLGSDPCRNFLHPRSAADSNSSDEVPSITI